MNKEKPPVLNGQQTLEWLRKKCGGNLFSTTVPNVQEEREAQRDADVEWFRNCWSKTLGQARQETAREIFEEIEQDFELDIETLYVLHIARFRWQALKSKFLEGK